MFRKPGFLEFSLVFFTLRFEDQYLLYCYSMKYYNYTITYIILIT